MARRFPAEWETQSAVQFTFPHPAGDWGPHYDIIAPCFAQIIQSAARFQPVLVVCQDASQAKTWLTGSNRFPIQLIEIPSNDSWARDHGGIVIFEDDRAILLDFMFNGWGLKFPANLDNLITTRLFEKGIFGNVILQRPGLVLEGGSIESDGQGTLLTTSRCLLSPNRNPHLSARELENKLSGILGLQRILWLDQGELLGDDTDAHIDTLARFCDPDTIAYVTCTDPSDAQYAGLKAMERELRNFRRPDGSPYELVPLPMPTPLFDPDGARLPATYANFLILNGAVLLPVYDVPEDEAATACLEGVFSEREIVPVPCRPLLLQHGSLHCVSMQYPKGVVRMPA